MSNIAIILFSLTILVLILYFANVKLRFRFIKKVKDSNAVEKEELERLSNSEQNILKLVSSGKSNQEIANELFISVHTVKKHISNIFKKLKLSSRTEARKYKNLIN
ncbi:MAG: DNA-binding response regulator [Bacteroidales bacterium]|nr:MAG: DNA-binding response regulator [Bacteroidales bacterium]